MVQLTRVAADLREIETIRLEVPGRTTAEAAEIFGVRHPDPYDAYRCATMGAALPSFAAAARVLDATGNPAIAVALHTEDSEDQKLAEIDAIVKRDGCAYYVACEKWERENAERNERLRATLPPQAIPFAATPGPNNGSAVKTLDGLVAARRRAHPRESFADAIVHVAGEHRALALARNAELRSARA